MAGPTVDAVVMRQRGTDLFLFSMRSDALNDLCYVTPRSHDNPEEVQRILSEKRAKEIGAYIQEENTLLPTAIVVSLEPDVEVRDTGTPGVKTLAFPDVSGKFAYVLDGQHRLAGFRHSGAVQFDLPVIALYNADEALRAKVFADINSKQEKITDVLILELYYQIKELGADDSGLMDVIHGLNDLADSPLKGRIKVLDDDKGTWIKNTILKRFLTRAVKPSGISVKSSAQQTTIIKEYFKAIAELWPDAWADRKGHSLCGSFGFEVMLAIFPQVKHRVDLNAAKEYSAKNFIAQMQPLEGSTMSIKVSEGEDVKLVVDWQRGNLQLLSNQPGRERLIDHFRDLLAQADEGP